MSLAIDGFTTLGAELAALAPTLEPQTRQRYPVHRTKRTEERAEIPYTDRLAVYTRNHFRCVWCGSGKRLTLDHVIPWSAGGSDHVDNLRTLCWDCNEHRSNFHLPADETYRGLPLVFWCADCDPVDAEDRFARSHPGVAPAYCYWCKVPSVGIPHKWFEDNNAFWDYDLNWTREKPPGFTRDLWERWISDKKFPPWDREPITVPWECLGLDLTNIELVPHQEVS